MEFVLVLGLILGFALWWAAKRSSGSKLGGEPQLSPTAPDSAPPTSFDDAASHFEIGRQFFVDVSSSPDGRFKVGACDRNDEGGRERRGACALLENGKVLFKRSIRRANNPHVTNEGIVIVEDWKDDGKLNGALLGFDRTGRPLWRHDFRANIDTSGVSQDGRRAFVSTCNSDCDAHSGMTFLVAVAGGEILWKRDGWGDVCFRENDCGATTRHLDGTVLFFPFDETGKLGSTYADDQVRIRAEQEWGKYWAVFPRVELGLKRAGISDLDEVASLLAQLDGKDDELSAKSRAKLLRYRGDLAEARGDIEQARSWWEKAYAVDPKVGVRRKLAKAGAPRLG